MTEVSCTSPSTGPTLEDSPDRLDRFFSNLKSQERLWVSRVWSAIYDNSRFSVITSYKGMTYADKFNVKKAFQLGLFDDQMCRSGIIKITDPRNNKFYLPALCWYFIESEKPQLLKIQEWMLGYLANLKNNNTQNVVLPADKEIIYRAGLPLKAGWRFLIDVILHKAPPASRILESAVCEAIKDLAAEKLKKAEEGKKRENEKQQKQENEGEPEKKNRCVHSGCRAVDEYELIVKLHFINTHKAEDPIIESVGQGFQAIITLDGFGLFLEDQAPFLGPLLTGLDDCEDSEEPEELPVTYNDNCFASKHRHIIDTREEEETFQEKVCSSFIGYNAY